MQIYKNLRMGNHRTQDEKEKAGKYGKFGRMISSVKIVSLAEW